MNKVENEIVEWLVKKAETLQEEANKRHSKIGGKGIYLRDSLAIYYELQLRAEINRDIARIIRLKGYRRKSDG